MGRVRAGGVGEVGCCEGLGGWSDGLAVHGCVRGGILGGGVLEGLERVAESLERVIGGSAGVDECGAGSGCDYG